MRISELMVDNSVVVADNLTVKETARLFIETGMDVALVVDGQGDPVGLITASHIVKVVADNLCPEIQVSELMSRQLKTLEMDDDLCDVIQSSKSLYPAYIVLKGNKPTGIVTYPVIIKALVNLLDDALVNKQQLETVHQELADAKKHAKELEVIFDSSFDGIWVTDGNGKTLRVNKILEKGAGIPLVGRTAKELIEEGFHTRSAIMRCIECKEVVTTKTETRNGKTVLVTSSPVIGDDGSVSLVITNVRDLTETEALQQRLEHMEGLNRVYQAELKQFKIQKNIIFRSSKMREIMDQVIRLATVDCTVLIEGESGVGKEIIADIIHSNSTRKEAPFIKINCGAIPEHLMESELFGYESGAFTGANKHGKAGLFELADGGTLFLDEIGEMPFNLQVKLLRALQDKKITRVGGTIPVTVDFRIISATNRSLAEMVAHKEFRKDLYYRLDVAPIHIPPLRERKEDIPILIQHFLEIMNRKYHLNKRLTSSTIDCLVYYDWPGNVRELENLIERLVIATPDNVITTHDLPSWATSKAISEGELIPLNRALENTERQLLGIAFRSYKTTRQMAQALGIHQSTLIRKAAKYGIKREL